MFVIYNLFVTMMLTSQVTHLPQASVHSYWKEANSAMKYIHANKGNGKAMPLCETSLFHQTNIYPNMQFGGRRPRQNTFFALVQVLHVLSHPFCDPIDQCDQSFLTTSYFWDCPRWYFLNMEFVLIPSVCFWRHGKLHDLPVQNRIAKKNIDDYK